MSLVSKNPIIYLIGGKSGSGKTTLGRLMKNELERNGKQVAIMEYAKYIKCYAKDYFGWDGTEGDKPRELLQKLGTDIIRYELDKPRFLIDRLCEDVEILSYFFDAIIVDDVRDIDEVETPKKLFHNVVTIKITRKKGNDKLTDEEKNHYTEIALDNYNKFDIFIENNGSLIDLEKDAKNIVDNEM